MYNCDFNMPRSFLIKKNEDVKPVSVLQEDMDTLKHRKYIEEHLTETDSRNDNDSDIDVTDDEIDVVTESTPSGTPEPRTPEPRTPEPRTPVGPWNPNQDSQASPPSSPSSPLWTPHQDLHSNSDERKSDKPIIKRDTTTPAHYQKFQEHADTMMKNERSPILAGLPSPPRFTPKLPEYRDAREAGWSPAATHGHPYLALSFQRLQEMHIRALQERFKYGIGMLNVPLNVPPAYQDLSSNMYLRSPESLCSGPALPRPDLMRPLPHIKWNMDSRAWKQDLNTPLNLVTKLSPSSTGGSTGSSPSSQAASPVKMPWSPTHPTSPMKLPWNPDAITLDLSPPTEPIRRRDEPPRYLCEACNKSYATFSGLSKHKQFHCTSHVKKQFSCKFCDKTYVSLGALKMHIRTHTLPCKCPLCGKCFSRPWLLQGHIRTHTGEKPFRCSHCSRSFADRSNLRAHLQTHSDIKKYSCTTCTKTFSRMSLLVKHQEGCSPIIN